MSSEFNSVPTEMQSYYEEQFAFDPHLVLDYIMAYSCHILVNKLEKMAWAICKAYTVQGQ